MAITSVSDSRNWITDSIPHELHSQILSSLDVYTLAKMTEVNTYWQSMASDDALWSCFWDKYHITDETTDLPKKIVMQKFICAQVEKWEAFLWHDFCPDIKIPNWLDEIKGKSPLQKHGLIVEKAPEFLKSVLQMSDPRDDPMRADFFFNYLVAGLPITPIISDAHAVFDIHRCYDGGMPMYFTLATFLLNVRGNNLEPLMEFCNLRAARNRTALTERPQRYVAGCDPNFLLIFEFTNAVFFSNGASFSELFKCPAFNPNFSLPTWIAFGRGSFNSLEPMTSKMSPFLSVFILQFFGLTARSRVHLNTHRYSSPEERIRSVQFDSSAYASCDLPFEITPQVISHEQLLKDLEILVGHPQIDLKAADSKGITALELVRKMKNHHAASSEDIFSQTKLETLAPVLSILERAQEVKDKESICPQ